MKTFLVIVAMIGLLSFTGAGTGKKDVTGLLNTQKTRQEIFQAIQNNPKLMAEFMQEMHWNRQAMTGQGNSKFMNQNYMLNMMRTNPGFMQQMMSSMIGASAKDSTWSRQMINYMAQYPQMRQMMSNHMSGMMGNRGYGMTMGGNNHSMMYSHNSNK